MIDGQVHFIPLEVLLMVMAAGDSGQVGQHAPVSLLAWCDLGREILLIMERPPSCMDLRAFMKTGCMNETMAQVVKLTLILL